MKGGSAGIDRSAVLTRVTVAVTSVRGSGVPRDGIRAMAIMGFTIFTEAGLRYRNESTVQFPVFKRHPASRVRNHGTGLFIPAWVRFPAASSVTRAVPGIKSRVLCRRARPGSVILGEAVSDQRAYRVARLRGLRQIDRRRRPPNPWTLSWASTTTRFTSGGMAAALHAADASRATGMSEGNTSSFRSPSSRSSVEDPGRVGSPQRRSAPETPGFDQRGCASPPLPFGPGSPR